MRLKQAGASLSEMNNSFEFEYFKGNPMQSWILRKEEREQFLMANTGASAKRKKNFLILKVHKYQFIFKFMSRLKCLRHARR